MAAIVISLLFLCCAAQRTWSLDSESTSTWERSSDTQNTRRRYLLSSLDKNVGTHATDPITATYRIQRDWLTGDTTLHQIPEPDLYYQDLDTGERQLIWAFDDTLPRDILAGRPQIWLQATFRVERDAALLLPFLEHYSRLGVAFSRMIFTLVAPNLQNKELLQVQRALRHVGAAHHILLFSENVPSFCNSKEFKIAVYEANLRATFRVPIQDWIVAVEGNEFIHFHQNPGSSGSGGGGGGDSHNRATDGQKEEEESSISAEEFFEILELQGLNWVAGLPTERLAPSGSFEKINPKTTLLFGDGGGGDGRRGGLLNQFSLKCHIISDIFVKHRMKVAAYRGYLRPDMSKCNILAAEKAKSYFISLAEEKTDDDVLSSNSSKEENIASGREDLLFLYKLTPYSRYWEFYKTPLMVGNVYLWSERRAEAVAILYRFLWHFDSTILGFNSTHSRVSEEKRGALCEDIIEKHDAMVFDQLIKKGKVDLNRGDGGGGIQCEKEIKSAEEKHDHQLLPLGKDAALSLAALRSMY